MRRTADRSRNASSSTAPTAPVTARSATRAAARLTQEAFERPRCKTALAEHRLADTLSTRVLRARVTLVSMAETLTIRLDADDRAALEAAARGQGKGLSTFVREIAEAEARRMRREAIRAEGDRVVRHLAEHPEARGELDEIGTPLSDLP